MAKSKLKKLAELSRLENFLEYTDYEGHPFVDVTNWDEKPIREIPGGSQRPAGRWADELFGNSRPIVLELACGKGEYALGLARKFPDINVVGIDIKGARIWRGARTAHEEGLNNVRFLRCFIDHLEWFFAPGEVSEIWITFPDPYLKSKKSDKRLTSSKFLNIYRNVLKPGAQVNLKTDSPELFQFTLETIESEGCTLLDRSDDVRAERAGDELLSILTFYERMHLKDGRTIRYLRFSL